MNGQEIAAVWEYKFKNTLYLHHLLFTDDKSYWHKMEKMQIICAEN
jgi:hypothetical protein